MRRQGRPADDLTDRTVALAERTRPAGVSPGTGAFIAAWLVAGAIARLTGTPVVIALMAGFVVAVLADVLGGWLAVRRATVHSIVGPTVTTVGTDNLLTLEFDLPHIRPPHVRRSAHLRISTPSGPVAHIDLAAIEVGHAERHTTSTTSTVITSGRFDDPGVLTELHAAIEVVGPLGLLWWRRSVDVPTAPIHAAPAAQGPLVTVTSSTSPQEGLVASERGNHHGDVDGVRPWREGDAVGAVHWASSMRARELIVHDRAAVTDERWVLDIDAALASPIDGASQPNDGRDTSDGGPAARIRWTLDEGLRRGHEVAVITAGVHHVVRSEVDAARWSAVAAQARKDRRSPGTARASFWRRPITAGAGSVETDTSVGTGARWAAAGAALASLATLVGGLATRPTFFTLLVILAVGVAVGAAASLRISRRSGRRPALLHAAIAVTVLLALIAIAVDARNVDGLLAVLRGPMPNLLVLLVVLHGFEVVDRRTLRVHQAITFVVAAYAAGLRIDDALGWWLGMWAVTFVVSLLLTSRPTRTIERSPRRVRDGIGDHVGGTSRAVVRTPLTVGRVVRPLVWIGASVVATLALLSVVPVPDGPARLGLPALAANATAVASPGALAGPDGSQTAPDAQAGGDRGSIGGVVGYPGFTETLDTSIRGDLGDEVVMRVRAPEPAFWRGQTFSQFDGRTWTVSPELGQRSDGPIIEVPPTIGDVSGDVTGSEEFIQTFFVETDLPNLVYAASRPTQVVFDGALWTRPDAALRSDVTLTKGSVYTVVSDRIQVTAEALRAQGDLGEVFRGFRESTGTTQVDPFLELPASTTSRTVDLAASLRAESTYDTILAYEQWIAANTKYDLDAPVPPAGADAVDDFLFESRLGYCEQIASSLVIMLRSQGVPARLATGYVAGERDRVSGVWKVRARDAHAWVEVWFPATGWEAFDPTADVPLAGAVDSGTVGGDLIGATISSVVAYRLQLAAMAVLAVLFLLAGRVGISLRYRRRRGRWGVLQDRFTALARLDDGTPPTNPARAEHVHEPADEATTHTAAIVADTLDRVAFDPTWVDDDETFERTRAAVATLERRPR